MARTRKKTLNPPRTAWESALDESEGFDRSQAGEIEPGDEAGGRNKAIDAETGDGGYGGDAALAGHDASAAQANRPLDREIHGDPRTHEGEEYPNDAKLADERQGPMAREAREIEDESGEDDTR